MTIIENQRIYQCDYCKRRFLSKKGCKIHEDLYCKDKNSPNQIRIRKVQEECEHNNTDYSYSYIPGEAVKEPNYKYCLDCGKVL